MAEELASFDPAEFGGSVVQDAPAAAPTKVPAFDPSEFGGDVVDQPPQAATFDPSEFGGTPIDSRYKDVATPPLAYTNSVREDMLSRWQTTYSKMPEGPERDRYGKLLAQAWDAHVDMQRYNDPLLFRAAETGTVTGGVGLMKGGLAGGEILLDLPGVDQIPGAETAKGYLRDARESLQAKQNLFEAKEEQFDKESAIGQTAAGLTRSMSGFATQLLMAYSVPGAGATAGTLPIARSAVSVGEVALAAMLGSEAAADSLAAHPGDSKTALLHGIVNGGAALFLGKAGGLAEEAGAKYVPQAVRAVSKNLKLTPAFKVLAHSQGAGAEMAATAATDYMMDVALTKDTFDSDELVRRMKSGYKSGAIMGGAMEAGGQMAKAFGEIGETLKKRQEQLPTANKAIADAREMFQKNEADIEAGIAAKFKEGETRPEGYDDYFNGELDALQNLESEYRDNYKSVQLEREQIKTRREETQAHLDELDRLQNEMLGIIDDTGHRVYKQAERADMMVEGSEGAIKDLDGMRNGLIAEMKGLDEREFQNTRRAHALDRNGKSVKEFVASEMDRLINEESLITEQSAHDKFSKDLDDAVNIENEIATNGRTKPEPPIPGQEQANVPDTATDAELVDKLGHITVSGRQRDLNKMRDFFDLERMEPGERQGVQETLIKAEQRGLIDNAHDVALDALTSGRLLDSEEFIGVVERGRQNKSKYIDLMKERAAATTPEQAMDIDIKMKGLEEQQDLLTQAAYRNNSDVGRRLNLAKMKLEEAYDPMALLSKANRALASRAKDRAGVRDLTDIERSDILNLANRIAENEKIKRENPNMDSAEFQRADYNAYQARIEADRYIDKLRPRSYAVTLAKNATVGLQDMMKALQLSLDTSVLTMHGGVAAMTQPQIIPNAVKGYFKTLRNPEELLAANRQVFERRANSDLYQKYNLGLVDVNVPRTNNENILLSAYSGQIPLLARLNNGNTVALNNLRADLFDALVASKGGRDALSHDALQSVAQYVRYATGRGDLGGFDGATKALSSVFLAPRWFISRFQHVSGAPMWRALMNREVGTASMLGREYAKHYLATSAAGYIAMNVAALAFPGQVSYVSNPLDPNYGLLTINGVQHDITSGLRKPIRLVTAAGRSLLGFDKKSMDTTQAIGGLFTNALGPGGRKLNEALTRKEMGTGDKINFSDPGQVAWFAANGFIPLPVQNFVRGLTEEGMNYRTADDTAAALMGLSAWKEHKKKK